MKSAHATKTLMTCDEFYERIARRFERATSFSMGISIRLGKTVIVTFVVLTAILQTWSMAKISAEAGNDMGIRIDEADFAREAQMSLTSPTSDYHLGERL